MVAKKNAEDVLRARTKVIGQVPNVVYLVLEDGEERERAKTLCEELGLRPHVCFVGHIDNSQLPALYCASNLFVMPSYEVEGNGDIEIFGISFIEANAFGLPSEGIADAVIDRLLTDRELARRLGENGRLRVERELIWDKVGERLVELLHSVITDTRTSRSVPK